ncbi:thioesterase II family protein [Plantactinospora sonchi]|uniref:Alpha/beta fold hydrolase n=1 Tax=Plantactinospora sonchi TaxID=1544735 RepID=A0ABU7RT36_9ACTN
MDIGRQRTTNRTATFDASDTRPLPVAIHSANARISAIGRPSRRTGWLRCPRSRELTEGSSRNRPKATRRILVSPSHVLLRPLGEVTFVPTNQAVRISGDVWFRAYRRVDNPTLRLICLPHAGGVPTAFRGWPPLLPEDVQMLAVCYPGRQDRLTEPCITTMDEMADRLCAALLPYADRPLALFGHSMGAAIAHEVAGRLEARHEVRPVGLFLSGRPAPARSNRGHLHKQDDQALVREVHALGAADVSAYDNPDLRELLLPALRADYRLIETYRPDRPPTVTTPIVGYLGDADPAYRPDDMASWADVTTAGCTVHILPGGHFYLDPQEKKLVSNIASHLAGITGRRAD